MRKTLGLIAIAALALPTAAAAVTLDFEDVTEGYLPTNYYQSRGVLIESNYVFQVPNLSWASARSGIQGICPIANNDHFGNSWSSIVSAHGVGLSGAGGATSDVFFVEPSTTTAQAITSFSIGYGYDSDGGESNQAVIIEAFDASGARVLDVVRTGLYYDGYETFSAPGAVRLRLTQNGYVGFDDLSFTPVPEPSTIAALSLGALVLLRRRKQG